MVPVIIGGRRSECLRYVVGRLTGRSNRMKTVSRVALGKHRFTHTRPDVPSRNTVNHVVRP